MDEEDREKILKIFARLADKAEELSQKLRNETLSKEVTIEDETFELSGINVFLLMLDAKEISEPLEQLHQMINLKQ